MKWGHLGGLGLGAWCQISGRLLEAGTLSRIRVRCPLSEVCLFPGRVAVSINRSLTWARQARILWPQFLSSWEQEGGWHMRVTEMTESVVSGPRTGIC